MGDRLYVKGDGAPAPLPARLRLPDGSTRTDPSTFTPELIAAAGYFEAPEAPEVGPDQAAEWSGGQWVVTDRPPVARQLSRFEFMSLFTPQERIKLRARAASDPVLADALALLELAAHVDPAHPMIGQMLEYSVSVGALAPARRAALEASIAQVAK